MVNLSICGMMTSAPGARGRLLARNVDTGGGELFPSFMLDELIIDET